MNPLASLEAALAALVVLWLAVGLLANPLLLGAVALLALVPLAVVVLPALGVHAFVDRSVAVRLLPPIPAPADADRSDRHGVSPDR